MRYVVVVVVVLVVVAGGLLAYLLEGPKPEATPTAEAPVSSPESTPPAKQPERAERAPAPAPKSEAPPQTPAGQAASDSERRVRAFGTVTNARTGEPIANATLVSAKKSRLEEMLDASESDTIELPEGLDSEEAARPVTVEAQSDAAGVFEIPVSVGMRELFCIARGYASASLPLPDLQSGDARVDFQLLPEAAIAGRVVDEEGRGVEGVAVSIEDVRERQKWFTPDEIAPKSSMPEVQSGADGAFTMDGLAPGNYRVLAAAETKGLLFDSKRAPVVNLEEGQHLDGVMLPVSPGGVVSGTISDVKGKPLPGARVSAFYLVSDFDFSRDIFSEHLSTTAGSDGEYTIQAIRLGEDFQVAAQHEDWAAAKSASLHINDASQALSIDLALTPGSRVSGLVVDAQGKPVSSADVSISPRRVPSASTRRRTIGRKAMPKARLRLSMWRPVNT